MSDVQVYPPLRTIRPWLPVPSGMFIASYVATSALTTFAHALNVLYFSWIPIASPITVTLIGIEVTTGVAGNLRLGIYNDSSGVPGTLLLDAGVVTTTTTGLKSVAISQALPVGHYWLASVSDAGPTVRAIANTTALHVLGFSSGTDTTVHAGVSHAFTYAALPASASAVSLMTTAVPRVMLQY